MLYISLCIDLMFTTQPNILMESGVHLELNANCHHHVIVVKFNLKTHCCCPPYELELWHYQSLVLTKLDKQ